MAKVIGAKWNVCSICGCVVPDDMRDVHEDWHEGLGE
jgi:hypothetical protein